MPIAADVGDVASEIRDMQSRLTTDPGRWGRVALGSILLVAAALKSHQLITQPVPELYPLGSRWVAIVAVEWELVLGAWLLSQQVIHVAWWAALATFGTFTVVTLGRALAGESSCGCFGAIEINPWATLGFDVASIAFLLATQPADGYARARLSRHSWLLLGIVGVLLVAAIAVGVAMATATPSTLSSAGVILGDDDLVILEPEQWVGGRLPLFDYVDADADLTKGAWIIVLYHDGCPKCQEVLPRYQSFARENISPQVAFIEVGRTARLLASGPWVVGRLSSDREWFVTTPVAIALEDGVVTRVALDEGGLVCVGPRTGPRREIDGLEPRPPSPCRSRKILRYGCRFRQICAHHWKHLALPLSPEVLYPLRT